MSISIVVLIQAFLLLVAANLLLIAWLSWHRPTRAPESGSIALLSLVSAIYCLGYAGELEQTTVEQAFFWLHVEYLGIPWVPALWLLAARQRNRLPEHRGWLFLIPVLTFLAQQTNALHHLYDRSLRMEPHGPFWVVVAERGPFAWLNLAYLYCALLYGLWIYLFGPYGGQYNRLQKVVLGSLALAPMAGYLLYFFGISPWNLDIAPATLGVTVLAGYFAIFRLGCFELMPAAHSLVFNSIRDAVLIGDLDRKLVDLNPAARQLLSSLTPPLPVTLNASLPAPLDHVFHTERTLELTVAHKSLHYELRLFPLHHHKQHFGYAAILADITTHVQMMHELRQKAETDPLTGVANRRSFLNALKQEFLAPHQRQVFSLMLLDFDGFKEINDRYGHPAGDKVLITFAQRILQTLREDDLLGRLGGDEFAILLPRLGTKSAFEVAERLRAAICNQPVKLEEGDLTISISIGLATCENCSASDWKELYKTADQALYEAKNTGKNRVVLWKSPNCCQPPSNG